MRAPIAAAAAGLLATALLSACGAGGGSAADATGSSSAAGTSGTSATVTSAGAGGTEQPAGSTVEVEARDFTLELASTTLSPGEHTFRIRNGGSASHAIEVDGPGVEDQGSDIVGPGGTASLTVTLQPGQYTLYCPVGNHRAMGMQTTFTVR